MDENEIPIDQVLEAFDEIEQIAARHGCAVRIDRNLGRIGLDGTKEQCRRAQDEIRRVFGKSGKIKRQPL